MSKKRGLEYSDEEIDDEEALCSEDEEEYGEIMRIIEENAKLYNSNGSIKSKKVVSDEEDLEDKREKVVKFISDLDIGKNLKRSGAIKDENFNLRRVEKEKGFRISDLISTIEDEVGFGKLKSKYHKLIKSSLKKDQLIDPQLNNITRDKLERKTAYIETKKEVSKWSHIVKQNREVEHLSFPLYQPAINDTGNCSTLASEHTPSNELEVNVNNALRSYKLRDSDIVKAENDRFKTMSFKERSIRIAELSKIRALIFYKNQELKRISKIKSRTYRKYHRKKEPCSTKDDIEKGLYLRAQERMSLRHKKIGAWRKGIVSNSELNKNIEQANNESSDSDSEYSDDSKKLKHDLISIGQKEVPESILSLANMKFMQRAIQNDVKEIQKEVNNTLTEIESFTNSNSQADNNNLVSNEPKFTYRTSINREHPHMSSENPWISASINLSSSKSNTPSGKNYDIKTSEKISRDRKSSKRNDLKNFSRNISIELSTLNQLSEKVDITSDNKIITKFDTLNDNINTDSLDTNSENNPPTLLTTSQIMKMVFANDELHKDFLEEKDACINEEAPKFQDITLPGWGSFWSGPGINQKPHKFSLITPGKNIKDRKDFKLNNVIISEKKNKKFSDKYQINKVPFGYGVKEHYERLIRMPIGKDWNALGVYRNMIKPRVKVLRGSLISPIRMKSSEIKVFEKKTKNIS